MLGNTDVSTLYPPNFYYSILPSCWVIRMYPPCIHPIYITVSSASPHVDCWGYHGCMHCIIVLPGIPHAVCPPIRSNEYWCEPPSWMTLYGMISRYIYCITAVVIAFIIILPCLERWNSGKRERERVGTLYHLTTASIAQSECTVSCRNISVSSNLQSSELISTEEVYTSRFSLSTYWIYSCACWPHCAQVTSEASS